MFIKQFCYLPELPAMARLGMSTMQYCWLPLLLPHDALELAVPATFHHSRLRRLPVQRDLLIPQACNLPQQKNSLCRLRNMLPACLPAMQIDSCRLCSDTICPCRDSPSPVSSVGSTLPAQRTTPHVEVIVLTAQRKGNTSLG